MAGRGSSTARKGALLEESAAAMALDDSDDDDDEWTDSENECSDLDPVAVVGGKTEDRPRKPKVFQLVNGEIDNEAFIDTLFWFFHVRSTEVGIAKFGKMKQAQFDNVKKEWETIEKYFEPENSDHVMADLKQCYSPPKVNEIYAKYFNAREHKQYSLLDGTRIKKFFSEASKKSDGTQTAMYGRCIIYVGIGQKQEQEKRKRSLHHLNDAANVAKAAKDLIKTEAPFDGLTTKLQYLRGRLRPVPAGGETYGGVVRFERPPTYSKMLAYLIECLKIEALGLDFLLNSNRGVQEVQKRLIGPNAPWRADPEQRKRIGAYLIMQEMKEMSEEIRPTIWENVSPERTQDEFHKKLEKAKAVAEAKAKAKAEAKANAKAEAKAKPKAEAKAK